MIHICVGKLTNIGSDNGLSPGRRQANIRTNARILLIGHLGTNFSEIIIEIETFSFKKMHLKMSSLKWHPFCLGFNVLSDKPDSMYIYSSFPSRWVCVPCWKVLNMRMTQVRWEWTQWILGGRFKNAYELLNLRTLKIWTLYKNDIFQCIDKIVCGEFQRYPLKFHTKYLTHTLKDMHFIHSWKFMSSQI